MTQRIVIPCVEDEPWVRHRWKLTRHYHSTPEQTVYDDQCVNCLRWRTDVLESADEERARRRQRRSA